MEFAPQRCHFPSSARWRSSPPPASDKQPEAEARSARQMHRGSMQGRSSTVPHLPISTILVKPRYDTVTHNLAKGTVKMPRSVSFDSSPLGWVEFRAGTVRCTSCVSTSILPVHRFSAVADIAAGSSSVPFDPSGRGTSVETLPTSIGCLPRTGVKVCFAGTHIDDSFVQDCFMDRIGYRCVMSIV